MSGTSAQWVAGGEGSSALNFQRALDLESRCVTVGEKRGDGGMAWQPAGNNTNPQQSDDHKTNPLHDVQNVLGFLLAGFAGVLSFLGLRSGEVSAVLRNPSTQEAASFIAAILFLAVFAAIVGVAVSGDRKMPVQSLVPIALLLCCAYCLMLYYTPVILGDSEVQHRLLAFSGLFFFLAVAATILLVVLEIRKPEHQEVGDPSSSGSQSRFAWLRRWNIQFICIIASLTLLGTSIYGSLRLEAFSQRVSVVQISANIAKASPAVETLSAHVTGAKLQSSKWLRVSILGLPKTTTDVIRLCSYSRFPGRCVREPCFYSPHICKIIYDAVVPVNTNGGINYTLSDGLVPGRYQDIFVQVTVCSRGFTCLEHSRASWLDIHLSKLPAA